MQYRDLIKKDKYEIDLTIGVPEEENGFGVVFAHGAGASNLYLNDFTEYFNKKGFYTVAPQFLYSGETKIKKPKKEISIENNEEILKISGDELKHMGLRLFGAGHSLGSIILSNIAEEYKDLEKLALLCPPELRNLNPVYSIVKIGCAMSKKLNKDFPVRRVMLSRALNVLDKDSREWLKAAVKIHGPVLFPEKYDSYLTRSILESRTFKPLYDSKTEAVVFLGNKDPMVKPLKKYFEDGKNYGNIKFEYFDGAHLTPFFYPEKFSEKMIEFYVE